MPDLTAWRKGLRQHRSAILCCLGMAAVQLALLYWYLRGLRSVTGRGVVGDDPWIHLTLARYLSQEGLWHRGLGPWDGGTSSLLWVLLLAVGYRLTGTMVRVVWGWGALSLTAATLLLFDLARGGGGGEKGAPLALLIAGLYGSSGIALLAALSGMETGLFVALGLLAIWAFCRRSYLLAGLSLGLLMMTRVEGIGLLLLLVGIYFWRARGQRRWRGILQLVGTAGVLLLLGMLYSWWATGTPLPTTFQGRKWLWWRSMADRVILLNGETATRYLVNWFQYLDGWLFSTYPLAGVGIRGAIIRLLLWCLLVLGLIRLLRLTWRWLRISELDSQGALPLLLGWTLAHNLEYMLFVPVPSLRHQPMNIALLAACLGLGCEWGWDRLGELWPQRRKDLPWLVAVGLLLYTLPSNGLWRWRYVTHVQHTNDVHVRMAQWVAGHLPPDAPVAAFDIGALAYFGEHRVIDLSGLTDPRYAREYLLPGQVLAFLREKRVPYLVIPSTGESRGLLRDLGLYDEGYRPRFRGRELQRYTYPLYLRPPFDRAPCYFYPIALGLSLYELEW